MKKYIPNLFQLISNVITSTREIATSMGFSLLGNSKSTIAPTLDAGRHVLMIRAKEGVNPTVRLYGPDDSMYPGRVSISLAGGTVVLDPDGNVSLPSAKVEGYQLPMHVQQFWVDVMSTTPGDPAFQVHPGTTYNITRTGLGVYRFTHNYNDLWYTVQITPITTGAGVIRHYAVSGKALNTFDVRMFDGAGAAVDCDFFATISKRGTV